MKFWPAANAGGAKPQHAVQSCISYMKARLLRFRSAHLRRRPKFHFGTPFFHMTFRSQRSMKVAVIPGKIKKSLKDFLILTRNPRIHFHIKYPYIKHLTL
ncbi:MAG: hypothetical protein GY795_01475 [Desulfobacterales bacterium]|nr:hypothetical protein [Desulfobacterales bacterium]